MTLEQAGDTVNVPRRGGHRPTEWILGVHVVDMLVHRWDLAAALGAPLIVPAPLTESALPLARANTAPGSSLNGPGGDYRQPFALDAGNSTMDTIVALLGRAPRWSPRDR